MIMKNFGINSIKFVNFPLISLGLICIYMIAKKILHNKYYVISDQDFDDGDIFKNINIEIENDYIMNKVIKDN